MTQIPLVDLRLQHQQIADKVESGFARVLRNASFILGEDVAEFEERFAQFCEVRHCVGVASGTDALELMLRAAGIGAGDEVILPANAFIATALAVARIGAVPVLVDCDPAYCLIDVDAVGSQLTRRTKVILPVHLYGQMAPVEELVRRFDVPVLEDAAQCQGARRHGRPPAAVGRAAATSFYPGKNLGAYGDAGAVLTNDEGLARSVRELRNYGSDRERRHVSLGFNSRLDTLQAVVLNAKLELLDAWNKERRAAARRYDELLADVGWVSRPQTLPGNEHVWHLYVIRVPERDAVLRRLKAAGIHASVHYPVPIHLTSAFAHLGQGPGSFPVAEKLAGEILSLPLFPGLSAKQQRRVAEELRRG